MRYNVAGWSLLVALSISCRAKLAPTNEEPSPADRRAELLASVTAASARAASGNYVAVLSELFAPQGVYLSNTPELLRGGASASEWMSQRDSLATRSRAQWTVVHHDVSADGRDGFTYGYFDVAHPAGDTTYGAYRAYWRRSASGQWQILAFARGRRAPGSRDGAIPSALADMYAQRFPMRDADTVAALAAIERTEAAFSDSAGVSVAAAFSAFAAPDAGKLETGAHYVFGKAAIGELFKTPPPGSLGPVWQPRFGSVAASGDLGFTLGPAWPRQPGSVQSAPPPNAGRYFTIWKRQRDGSYRYLVD